MTEDTKTVAEDRVPEAHEDEQASTGQMGGGNPSIDDQPTAESVQASADNAAVAAGLEPQGTDDQPPAEPVQAGTEETQTAESTDEPASGECASSEESEGSVPNDSASEESSGEASEESSDESSNEGAAATEASGAAKKDPTNLNV